MPGVLTPGTGNDFHYRGTTDSGAPSTGSFTAGDWVEDGAGGIQLCTIAGTPGTWASLASGATPGFANWTIVGNVPAAHTTTGGTSVVREDITLTGNPTLTVALSNNQEVDIALHQDGTGSRTVTWVGVDVWATSTAAAPVLATTAAATDRLYFEKINGTTYGYFITEAVTAGVSKTGGGKETVFTNATAGSTEAINLANGNVQDITLDSATCAITLTGATNGVACTVLLMLRQDATGGRLATWPTVTWSTGAAPVLTPTAGAVDFVTLTTVNGGTTWFGFTGVPTIQCKAQRTTDQTITTGTAVPIQFNAADEWDTHGLHDHTAGSPGNGKITFPVAGKWRLLGALRYAGVAAAGTGRFHYFRLNGATVLPGGHGAVSGNSTSAEFAPIAYQGLFAANDYVELIFQQDSGSDLTMQGATRTAFLAVEYMGP